MTDCVVVLLGMELVGCVCARGSASTSLQSQHIMPQPGISTHQSAEYNAEQYSSSDLY